MVLHGQQPVCADEADHRDHHKKSFLEAYQVRQAVYVELKQYDKALEDCQMCLKLKDDEQAYFNLAKVYEKLGMDMEAEAGLQRIPSKKQTSCGHTFCLCEALA